MANNTLRMSGLNSGLDTEAIVNALTAATKNKINKNQRSILTLQAQQDAYRSIIDKLNAFKSKYLDILNVGTCLKSKTMFNSFKSTLTSSSGNNYVPGVTVTSSTNANEASYHVKVNKVATQSTYKSYADNGKAVDLSQCVDPNQEYAMKVSVGSKTAYVTFHGGSEEDMIKDINDQLKETFGVSNSGDNLVYIDETTGKFVSSDKSSVVYSSPTLYDHSKEIDTSGMQTGRNSFDITINGVTRTVTFDTLAEDYFDDLFDGDKLLSNEEIEEKINNTAGLTEEDKAAAIADLKERRALYEQVVLNQRDGVVYDKFKDWWGHYDEEGNWVDGTATDAEKQAFAEKIAQDNYDKNMADVDKWYNNTVEAQAKLAAYNKYVEEYKESDEYQESGKVPSFNDFLESKGDGYDFAQEIADFKASDDGAALELEYKAKQSEVDRIYDGYNNELMEKDINASYNEYFDKAKEAAYNQAIADGTIQNTDESADNYVASYKDYEGFTKADFEAYTAPDDDEENKTYTNSFYNQYLAAKAGIEQDYADKADAGYHSIDLDTLSQSQLMSFYDEYLSADAGVPSKEDFVNNYADYMGDDAKAAGASAAREAVYQFNKANIENTLNNIGFNTLGGAYLDAEYGRDGKLNITATSLFEGAGATDTDEGFKTRFSITANANSKNDFGLEATDVSGTASQISTTSKLSELGLEPDANGNYNFSINGVSFSFSGDTTISEMMKKVNASSAGVKMSYTTLTNQFIITSNEYGTGTTINLEDGGQKLLTALGFADGDGRVDESLFTEGTNTNLTINGHEVETTSNSYTVDGTTFTFTQAAEGQEFTNEVSRDYSKAIDTIKSFVDDYNELIDFVYGYVDEEPNKDYYFLTDDDIDEMGLSETQQNKWEKMAKKGLLYRDSTLTDIMSKLRTVLYNSVDAADGSKVGLYTLGITTSSDYTNHGKLVFDDTKDFEALFEKYADEITELFSNTEKGIAYQFEKIIDNATRTTGGPGERGSLVDKAGVSGTASATSNAIYNKIKSLQDTIAALQRRYEQQQDRYWKIYGNMESMLGNLNSQTSYINQLLGNF